ncbi:carbohydrate kinase family protein [Arthrobacter dokdonensis]|uniref:carbohydrate kinase family protein n=1 Tax=Arthrobacter dokdonellae TaxID=2211210 RepID=UPI000DE5AB5F|nr:carbohydrate kinase [Arthrobacter dokdonellae]
MPHHPPPDGVPEKNVMVVGEALTDIVHTPHGSTEHPGGSPANVAYGLARLGVSTSLLTALAPDPRGKTIRRHLTDAGVRLLPESCSLARTSTATATIAPDGSASYAFDTTWQLPSTEDLPTPLLLHTGSIATFLEPGAATLRALLGRLHGTCRISYDPNIRPSLLGSQAHARCTFEDTAALSDVVKLSQEDAIWLYPDSEQHDVIDTILRLGVELVVVTDGAARAILATRKHRVTVHAVRTKVVDTIGAGDSYMAALIAGLLDTDPGTLPPPALASLGQMAATAAAITVSRRGAQPPTAAELNLPENQARIPAAG